LTRCGALPATQRLSWPCLVSTGRHADHAARLLCLANMLKLPSELPQVALDRSPANRGNALWDAPPLPSPHHRRWTRYLEVFCLYLGACVLVCFCTQIAGLQMLGNHQLVIWHLGAPPPTWVACAGPGKSLFFSSQYLLPPLPKTPLPVSSSERGQFVILAPVRLSRQSDLFPVTMSSSVLMHPPNWNCYGTCSFKHQLTPSWRA